MQYFIDIISDNLGYFFDRIVDGFFNVIVALLPSSQGFGPDVQNSLYNIISQTRVWGIIVPFDTMFSVLFAVLVFEGFLLGFKITAWVIGIAGKFFGVRI